MTNANVMALNVQAAPAKGSGKGLLKGAAYGSSKGNFDEALGRLQYEAQQEMASAGKDDTPQGKDTGDGGDGREGVPQNPQAMVMALPLQQTGTAIAEEPAAVVEFTASSPARGETIKDAGAEETAYQHNLQSLLPQSRETAAKNKDFLAMLSGDLTSSQRTEAQRMSTLFSGRENEVADYLQKPAGWPNETGNQQFSWQGTASQPRDPLGLALKQVAGGWQSPVREEGRSGLSADSLQTGVWHKQNNISAAGFAPAAQAAPALQQEPVPATAVEDSEIVMRQVAVAETQPQPQARLLPGLQQEAIAAAAGEANGLVARQSTIEQVQARPSSVLQQETTAAAASEAGGQAVRQPAMGQVPSQAQSAPGLQQGAREGVMDGSSQVARQPVVGQVPSQAQSAPGLQQGAREGVMGGSSQAAHQPAMGQVLPQAQSVSGLQQGAMEGVMGGSSQAARQPVVGQVPPQAQSAPGLQQDAREGVRDGSSQAARQPVVGQVPPQAQSVSGLQQGAREGVRDGSSQAARQPAMGQVPSQAQSAPGLQQGAMEAAREDSSQAVRQPAMEQVPPQPQSVSALRQEPVIAAAMKSSGQMAPQAAAAQELPPDLAAENARNGSQSQISSDILEVRGAFKGSEAAMKVAAGLQQAPIAAENSPGRSENLQSLLGNNVTFENRGNQPLQMMQGNQGQGGAPFQQEWGDRNNSQSGAAAAFEAEAPEAAAPAGHGAGAAQLNTFPQNIQGTAPAEAPTAAARPADYDVPGQIVEQARLIRSGESTEMVIHLKPGHLGDLTLRISVSENGAVTASFHSDNAQVRTIIENSLVQLRHELSEQGLKVDSVEVFSGLPDGQLPQGQGQQAWQQGAQHRFQGGGREPEDYAEEADDLAAAAQGQSQGNDGEDGVDYRV